MITIVDRLSARSSRACRRRDGASSGLVPLDSPRLARRPCSMRAPAPRPHLDAITAERRRSTRYLRWGAGTFAFIPPLVRSRRGYARPVTIGIRTIPEWGKGKALAVRRMAYLGDNAICNRPCLVRPRNRIFRVNRSSTRGTSERRTKWAHSTGARTASAPGVGQTPSPRDRGSSAPCSGSLSHRDLHATVNANAGAGDAAGFLFVLSELSRHACPGLGPDTIGLRMATVLASSQGAGYA
jgi:hypothetical protein